MARCSLNLFSHEPRFHDIYDTPIPLSIHPQWNSELPQFDGQLPQYHLGPTTQLCLAFDACPVTMPQQSSARQTRTGWHSLPAELRLMIYSFTLEPRKVVMARKLKRPPNLWLEISTKDWKNKYRIHSPPPATLHLSSEAREFTLRHLVPFFQTAESVAYLNPALDVLFLEVFPDPDEGGVRTVGGEFIPPTEAAQRFLSILSGVKHVHLSAEYSGPDVAYTLQLALLDGNLPALRTLDHPTGVFTHKDGESEGEWKEFWTRWCCMPDCARHSRRSVPGFLKTQLSRPPNRGRWKMHMQCYHPDHIQELAFPLRTCEVLKNSEDEEDR